MAGRLEDRVVLITDAASGLGAECARQFHGEGSRLVLVDRDAGRLAALAQGLDRDVSWLAGDVAAADTATRAVDLAVQGFGRLDVLLNDAAIDPLSACSVLDTSDQDWRAVIDVNLTAAFYFSRAAIATMRTTGGGAIVAVASISALTPTPEEAAYSVKVGLLHLMRAIALDHAKTAFGPTPSAPASWRPSCAIAARP